MQNKNNSNGAPKSKLTKNLINAATNANSNNLHFNSQSPNYS
jgi:hypothetical protein